MPAPARRCPYCHESIPAREYRDHVADHEDVRPDGQQRDHATLPPNERERGDIDDEPRQYRHKRCGVVTVMPEEIVRSYLRNPFMYNDRTFCCGCNTYVRQQECVWVETRQNLADYFDDLKDEAVRDGRGPKPIPGWVLTVLMAMGAGFGLGLLGAKLFGGWGFFLGGFLGFVLGGTIGLVVWLARSSGGGRRRDEYDDEADRPRRREKRREEYDDDRPRRRMRSRYDDE